MDLDQYLEKMNTNTKIIWIQNSSHLNILEAKNCIFKLKFLLENEFFIKKWVVTSFLNKNVFFNRIFYLKLHFIHLIITRQLFSFNFYFLRFILRLRGLRPLKADDKSCWRRPTHLRPSPGPSGRSRPQVVCCVWRPHHTPHRFSPPAQPVWSVVFVSPPNTTTTSCLLTARQPALPPAKRIIMLFVDRKCWMC